MDLSCRRLDVEAEVTLVLARQADLDAAAQRRGYLLGVLDKIIGYPLLVREGIGIDAGELQPGKPVMPGRAVGDEAVPSLRAPALGDPAALEDEVRDAPRAQVLAHGDARLASADNEHVDFFNRHFFSPSWAAIASLYRASSRAQRD